VAEWSRIARRVRVPLGFVLAVLYVWLAKPTRCSLVWGVVLILPGLLIRGLASGHVRKNEAVATSGPYAYTRNPLYLGSLLIGVGFAIAARSWWIGVALIVMFLAIYIPVIRSEEEFLRKEFPEFETYAQKVPRMLPRVSPYRSGESGAFSLALYRKHREHNALLGSLALLAVLMAKMLLIHAR
jgi:protein-S-isoprenylcysteine O-methyltransferase Ste14